MEIADFFVLGLSRVHAVVHQWWWTLGRGGYCGQRSRVPIEIHSAAEAKHGQDRRDAITTSWDIIGEKVVMLGTALLLLVFSFFRWWPLQSVSNFRLDT